MVSTRPLTSKSSRSFYQSFGDCTKSANYKQYNRDFQFPQFFNSLTRSRYISFFSFAFSFTIWLAETTKSTILQVLFFCCRLLQSLVVWPRLSDPFVCENPIGVCESDFPGKILGCALLLLLLFTPLEFLTSVLADGYSLEFEWQQVSASLQDSSQYSGRSQ